AASLEWTRTWLSPSAADRARGVCWTRSARSRPNGFKAAGEEAHARERHLPGFATHAADLAQPIGGQWRHHLGAADSDLRAALAACPPPDPVANRLGGRVRPG